MNIGDKHEKLYMNFSYYTNVDWGWGKHKLCEPREKKNISGCDINED